LQIRRSTASDRAAIREIHTSAFGLEHGREIAELVDGLLDDPTAEPSLSLVAEAGGVLAGHILFTAAKLQSSQKLCARILAPLAVSSEHQGTGIGGELIAEGLERLAGSGTGLVFVLGHPGYYPKHGFQPAGVLGLEAPHPIAPEHADAWMVKELATGLLGTVEGKVQVSEVLSQPQHWRE